MKIEIMKQEPKFPQLPPNQFWRVAEIEIDDWCFWYSATLVILVERKRGWFGIRYNSEIHSYSIEKEPSEITKEELVEAAEQVLKSRAAFLAGRKILGDYPPKQLPEE